MEIMNKQIYAMYNVPLGYLSVRRVVCAALRSHDGDLLLGIRHYSKDMYKQIHARYDGEKFLNLCDDNMGFVDQFGNYINRNKAYELADENRQILYPEHIRYNKHGPGLSSEVLY